MSVGNGKLLFAETNEERRKRQRQLNEKTNKTETETKDC